MSEASKVLLYVDGAEVRLAGEEPDGPEALRYGQVVPNRAVAEFVSVETSSSELGTYQFPDAFVRLKLQGQGVYSGPDCGPTTVVIEGRAYGVAWGRFDARLCNTVQTVGKSYTGKFSFVE